MYAENPTSFLHRSGLMDCRCRRLCRLNMGVLFTGLGLLIVCLLSLLPLSCDSDSYPYYLKSDHGVLWVANANDNTVTCIDRFNNELIGTYDVGPNPSRTAVDIQGNCWVGCRNDDSIWYVTADGERTEYNGFNAARGVALDRAGDVWVANSGNQTIQWIDVDSGTVSRQVTVPGAQFLYGAVVDAQGILWLSDRSGGNVIRYPTAVFPSQDEFTTIDVSSIYGITLDFDGCIWAAGQDGYIRRINPDDYSVDVWSTEAAYLSGTTVDANSKLWFCADQINALICFDPETETTETFEIGVQPHGIGADEAGFVYSINWYDNSVFKVDASSGEIVYRYTVGNFPYTYSDLTGFIYRNITLAEE